MHRGLIAQELPFDYNVVHGIVSAPSPSSEDGATGFSVAPDALNDVPCCLGVPQGGDTVEGHDKQPSL